MTKKLFLDGNTWKGGEFPEEPNEKSFSGDQWKENQAIQQYKAAIEKLKSEAMEVVNIDAAMFEKPQFGTYWINRNNQQMLVTGVLYPWDGGAEKVEQFLNFEGTHWLDWNGRQMSLYGCKGRRQVLRLLPKSPVTEDGQKPCPACGNSITMNELYCRLCIRDHSGIVAAGIPEQEEAIAAAYMDRIINTLIEKWNCDRKHARDIGRDMFYSFILPIYELGGQFGLRPLHPDSVPMNVHKAVLLRELENNRLFKTEIQYRDNQISTLLQQIEVRDNYESKKVADLEAETQRLKIELSNYAYQIESAKRERDAESKQVAYLRAQLMSCASYTKLAAEYKKLRNEYLLSNNDEEKKGIYESVKNIYRILKDIAKSIEIKS